MKTLKCILLLTLVLFALSCKEKPTELLQIDDPIFNPDPALGPYYAGQAVTLTCPEFGATIRYTVDGTDPTEQSPAYSSPLIIPNIFPSGATTATIKARAWKTGFDPSNVISATYTVTFFNTVATPHFSPLAGDILTSTSITILCSTLNAEVHYTLDGTDPDQSSPLFTTPFTLPQAGTVTVKAIAYRPNWNTSEIGSATYIVTEG